MKKVPILTYIHIKRKEGPPTGETEVQAGTNSTTAEAHESSQRTTTTTNREATTTGNIEGPQDFTKWSLSLNKVEIKCTNDLKLSALMI